MIQCRSFFCFKLRVSGILLICIYHSYLPTISQRNRWSRKFLVLLVLLISVLKLFWNISKVFGFKSSQFLLILNSKASHNRAILRQKTKKNCSKVISEVMYNLFEIRGNVVRLFFIASFRCEM